MSGILLNSGQYFVINSILTKINEISGLYVGLVSNTSNTTNISQLPYSGGLVEITNSIDGEVLCSGYSRQISSSWTLYSGINPYLLGNSVTFNASGTWNNVYGYFVSETATGYNALFMETFPCGISSVIESGQSVVITPKYTQL